MVDFECGELNWTEINQESKKKFHKLGKLGSSKSGEGIAKFGFSYPSHPFYSKYQATTSTRWKIYKKKNSHVKGKEPLINCLFFSFPLFYSEIQETTSTRWKTLTYIKTTPKSFFLDKNQEKFVFVSVSCSRSNFYFGFWYTRYFFSILIIAALGNKEQSNLLWNCSEVQKQNNV